MKRIINYIPTIVLLTSGLAACDSDDTSEVNGETAQLAMTALSTSTQDAMLRYQAQLGEGERTTVECAQGGSAFVEGDVLVEVDPVLVDVDLGIDYDGCITPRDVQLDGTVDFAQQVVVGGGDTVRVETTFAGDTTFSGAINAACIVDVHVLVDVTGKLVSVEGQACGHDAGSFDLTIMPHWR